MNKINLLVIDDQEEILDSFASWPSHYEDIGEVWLSQDQEQFTEKFVFYRNELDVVVMDLMLDTNIAISARKRYSSKEIFSGFALLEETQQTYPDTNIVIYSQFFNHSTVIECYRLGAKCFIPKGSWANDKVIKYLAKAASGAVIYPSEYEPVLKSKLLASKHKLLSRLNEKDVAILCLLVSRKSTEHIVKELSLASEQVLYNLVARMIVKLEIEPLLDSNAVPIKTKREILIEIGEKAGLTTL